MATQVTFWVAVDGAQFETESQCLAYETRLALEVALTQMRANPVDVDAVTSAVASVSAMLAVNVPAIQTAQAAEAVAASPAQVATP